MIKLLIVEDNKVMRQALIRLLDRESDITVMGEAENGETALELLDLGVECTMVLSDLNMVHINGLELTCRLQTRFPVLKVVILTMHVKPDYMEKAREYGASGYLLKQLEPKELLEALRRIDDGDRIFM